MDCHKIKIGSLIFMGGASIGSTSAFINGDGATKVGVPINIGLWYFLQAFSQDRFEDDGVI